jgi:hypothetical protein
VFKARVDQLVFDFNCRPLDYVDARWIEEPHGSSVALVSASTDAQARGLADRWLLQHFALDNAFDFDFSQPAKRVLLLDAPTLRDIARLLGLATVMHVVRALVTREQLGRLRSAVGDDVFCFAREHMLAWPMVAHCVLGATQRASLSQGGDDLWSGLHRLGAHLLLAAGDTPQSAALRRAELKLPPAWRVSGQRTRPLSNALRQRVADFAIGCVLRKRHPSWHWLF